MGAASHLGMGAPGQWFTGGRGGGQGAAGTQGTPRILSEDTGSMEMLPGHVWTAVREEGRRKLSFFYIFTFYFLFYCTVKTVPSGAQRREFQRTQRVTWLLPPPRPRALPSSHKSPSGCPSVATPPPSIHRSAHCHHSCLSEDVPWCSRAERGWLLSLSAEPLRSIVLRPVERGPFCGWVCDPVRWASAIPAAVWSPLGCFRSFQFGAMMCKAAVIFHVKAFGRTWFPFLFGESPGVGSQGPTISVCVTF